MINSYCQFVLYLTATINFASKISTKIISFSVESAILCNANLLFYAQSSVSINVFLRE